MTERAKLLLNDGVWKHQVQGQVTWGVVWEEQPAAEA